MRWLLLLLLLLSGCATYQDWTVEDWDVSYKHCQIKLDWQCFTLDVYNYLDLVYDLDFNVPLGVGVCIGERWEAPGSMEWEVNVEKGGLYWEKGERA